MAIRAQTSSGEVLEPWSPPERDSSQVLRPIAATCQKWKQHAHVLPIRDAARPTPITPRSTMSLIKWLGPIRRNETIWLALGGINSRLRKRVANRTILGSEIQGEKSVSAIHTLACEPLVAKNHCRLEPVSGISNCRS